MLYLYGYDDWKPVLKDAFNYKYSFDYTTEGIV